MSASLLLTPYSASVVIYRYEPNVPNAIRRARKAEFSITVWVFRTSSEILDSEIRLRPLWPLNAVSIFLEKF